MDFHIYMQTFFLINKYFVGILNSCIALPKKLTKLNVQQIKIMLQYNSCWSLQSLDPRVWPPWRSRWPSLGGRWWTCSRPSPTAAWHSVASSPPTINTSAVSAGWPIMATRDCLNYWMLFLISCRWSWAKYYTFVEQTLMPFDKKI